MNKLTLLQGLTGVMATIGSFAGDVFGWKSKYAPSTPQIRHKKHALKFKRKSPNGKWVMRCNR